MTLMAAQIFGENPCSHNSRTAGVSKHFGDTSSHRSVFTQTSAAAGDHGLQSKIVNSNAER